MHGTVSLFLFFDKQTLLNFQDDFHLNQIVMLLTVLKVMPLEYKGKHLSADSGNVDNRENSELASFGRSIVMGSAVLPELKTKTGMHSQKHLLCTGRID
jgi:hypothetical protein